MVVWELLTNFAVDCLGLGSIRMVVSLMDDRNYFDLWVSAILVVWVEIVEWECRFLN